MSRNRTKKSSSTSWGLIALMLVLLGLSVNVVKVILSEDHSRKKRSVVKVTLLKPPPQVKEEPKPEPVEPVEQVQQDEVEPAEIVAEVPQILNDNQDMNDNPDGNPEGEPDDAPAGDNLGLDAEGTAGSDAFGLVANKGGRRLLAGGGGRGGRGIGKISLLNKYAGYVQNLRLEIQHKVMQRMDEEGWFPKGSLQTSVRINIDSNGKVINYKIIGSSGNYKLDDAVMLTLGNYTFTEAPPNGKPKTMIIKIISQG